MVFDQVARLGGCILHFEEKMHKCVSDHSMVYEVYFKLYRMLGFIGVARQYYCYFTKSKL